ncbi:MAG: hypothetical protein JWM25_1971 [Thermoleophilia bacterium]|nr:hypothetical protein [Thermoleophilia bacterium]
MTTIDAPSATQRPLANAALDSVASAGRWAWGNKAEIGFWVGTSALLLAAPIKGGAAAAKAGGSLTSRVASFAAPIAASGKVGSSAVQLARVGVASVRHAKDAVAEMPIGLHMKAANASVHSVRASLGATGLGKAMIAAQKPVVAASTVIAGANFADTSVRWTQGTASNKDLALSTLGFAPIGVGAIGSAAAKRAAAANASAVGVVTQRLDDVAAHAAGATAHVDEVAQLAPTLRAPQTAGAAAAARTTAGDTTARAQQLAAQVSEETISASALSRGLDDVAELATTAKQRTRIAEQLAPTPLTPTVQRAHAQLDAAAVVAREARDEISSLAATQVRADRIADGADHVKGAIGATSMHAGNANNAYNVAREYQGNATPNAERSLVTGLTSWLLGRNARVPAPTTPRAGP